MRSRDQVSHMKDVELIIPYFLRKTLFVVTFIYRTSLQHQINMDINTLQLSDLLSIPMITGIACIFVCLGIFNICCTTNSGPYNEEATRLPTDNTKVEMHLSETFHASNLHEATVRALSHSGRQQNE